MKTSPAFYLLIAALIGSLLGFQISWPPQFLLSFSFFFGILAIFFPQKLGRAILTLAFCSFFVAFLAKINLNKHLNVIQKIPKEACIYEGIISDIAPTLEKGKKATFFITGLIDKNKRQAFSATFTLFLKEAAAAIPLSEGDRIRILGKAKRLKKSLSPGEFNAYWFGVARQIHGTLSVYNSYDLSILEKNARSSYFSTIRYHLRNQLLSLSTPRETGVLLALIIGDTNLFDENQKQIYQNLGAGHLLAVSGLQISLLALIFFYFFRFIFLLIPFTGRLSYAGSLAAWFSLAAIWVFTFLCSAPPSAVRAAAMSTVLLLSFILVRNSNIADAFGIAGLFSILLWPASAVDPSYLLSYAAVFGLILQISDSPQNKIVTLITASLGAGLMTLPVSAFLFGQVAPFGILVNVVLVPIAVFLQTPAIFFGILGTLFYNQTLILLGASFAGILESLCEMLNNYLGYLFYIQTPSTLATLLFFVSAISILLLFKSKQKIITLAFALTLLSIAWYIDFDSIKGIRISVLPVGQGDASVFEFPTGEVMLVDGGGHYDLTYDPGKEIIIPFLKRRGIQKIDIVALSHPDADHLIGLLSVMDTFIVKELWYRKLPFENILLNQLLEKAAQKNIKIFSNDDLRSNRLLGKTLIQILEQKSHPFDKFLPLKVNDNSLVIRIEYGEDSALWPGDIEQEGEKRIIEAHNNFSSTVVKAPHHGSKSSSSVDFVRKVKAKHVIFCTQEDNMWHFPHSQIVKRWHDRGAQIWNTGTQGEITIWLTGHGTLIKAYREEYVDEQ